MMLRRRFWFRVTAAVVLAAAVVVVRKLPVAAYVSYRIWPAYPRTVDQVRDLAGLEAPVDVYLDEAGVAHIRAASELDMARAAGYMQARERFFEMDMMRRFAYGRISELVGEQEFMGHTTVAFDRAMRAWGFGRGAEQDAAAMDAATRAVVEAFVTGVNAGLAARRPIEYKLVRVEPEPWRAADSFALARLNAWTITHNWRQELCRLLLALYGGTERGEALYPSAPWPGEPALAGSGPARELPPAMAPELPALFPGRDPGAWKRDELAARRGVEAFMAGIENASNAWVVSGKRSASGKPMVAGDPHLTHFLPSLVMQMHLSCPGYEAIGFTIPGIPYVLAGHNTRVAWSITSSVADVVDLYIEQVNPDNPNEVLTPEGYAPLETHYETIRVRRGRRIFERRTSFRSSRHGPLVNDMYPGLIPPWGPLVAIRWDTAGVADSMARLRAAGQARTVTELREAVSDLALPISTWIAADVEGNYALFTNGNVPVRTHHQGTFPAPGWLAAYDWQGTTNARALPAGLNGGAGFYAHGNTLLVHPRESDTLFHVDSAPSYRRDRIAALIEAKTAHTPESFAAIQRDCRLPRAEWVKPYMTASLTRCGAWDATERKALQVLRAWDCEAGADSPGAAVFFQTYREAAFAALRDEVPPEAFAFIMAERYSANVYDRWFADADHPVWDDRRTERVEGRDAMVQAAFRRAVAALVEELDEDPAAWRWGALHQVHIKHLFSRKPVRKFFSLPPAEAAGGLDSVWKSHFDLGNDAAPFKVTAGPAFRMVVDLADLDGAQWIIDTGNSGWPKSPHYGDQHELWKRGAYLPMVSDWAALEQEAEALFRFEPETGRQS